MRPPQRAGCSRRGCQWVSDGGIYRGGRHLNASSLFVHWHPAIICHHLGLLIIRIAPPQTHKVTPELHTHLSAVSTLLHPLHCVQPHSSNNNIMFNQQTDDDYTSFHSPLRQKIDKSDWSSAATHLFIQTVYRFHLGIICHLRDAERIISLSLRQIMTHISLLLRTEETVMLELISIYTKALLDAPTKQMNRS